MEVILTKRIKAKGDIGDIITVKSGYARNFLFPQGYAIPSTAHNLQERDRLLKTANKQREAAKSDFEAIAEKLNGKKLTIKSKVSKDKLYGSVTPAQIIDLVKENFKVDLEKQQLSMPDHIKTVGNFDIEVDLHPDVACQLKLSIQSEGEVEEPTSYEDILEKESTEKDSAENANKSEENNTSKEENDDKKVEASSSEETEDSDNDNKET
ncbi:50S ribosomal protein L9 [Candidatus Marinamargulisbacteria bacterium SCGC AG-439-L15]|nr:50S ribosomal protein L9 [Candidatus Marinamargulisbacteria bacterium SCGC AG-439-L15]